MRKLLLMFWVCQKSVMQRQGRAGRVTAGKCYHIYPKLIYKAMPEYQLPEILRTPLPELCLQMKLMHFGSIQHFLQKAMEPPQFGRVQDAIELLMIMGALDDEEQLTPLGMENRRAPHLFHISLSVNMYI